ncbi:MAG TPA: hypothetical protein VLE97_05405 [Gaiellaceae bacterium]|nr:hypothetical protein [Gaiellaceae bacterium]
MAITVTNQTNEDYWFGPLHLAAGVGQTLSVDDTSDTSLYRSSDAVADALNNLSAIPSPTLRIVELGPRRSESNRRLQSVTNQRDTLDPSHIGHVLGHGQAPAFAKVSGYVVVKLTVPLKVTRIFGGSAPKAGSIFLHEPPPAAATSNEAKLYLGRARETGNAASLKAYATIPAGTTVLIGLSAPGRTAQSLLGGKIVVELADASDATQVRYGHNFHLPNSPGSPFGDGPGLYLRPVGTH